MTILDENQRVEYFATHYKNYHPAYYDQLYREGIEMANKIEGIESADAVIKRILAKGFAKGYIDSNIRILSRMVSQGYMAVDEAAKEADMSPEEFALAKEYY